MVDETASHDAQEPNESGLSQISEVILGQVTGLPAPVQRTFWKAFGRLATSAVDVPAAYMEGKVAEIRATSDARVQVIKTSGRAIAEQIEAPPAYVEAASVKYAERIVGKQKNLDAIAHKAVNELPLLTPSGLKGDPAVPAEISDDWLNTFEAEAENMSSDYMRTVFGKLLAGEVARPGTFSRRAVKILGQMETREAEIFARFSSLAVQFCSDGQVVSGLLMTMGDQVGKNALRQYGLDYGSLLTLVEYGLVLAELDGGQQFQFEDHGDDLSFFHSGKRYRCVYEGPAKGVVQLYGLMTSRAGAELMQLVTPLPDPQYTARLEAHLKTLSLKLDEA
mgnify:CR=1 FL=1